MLTATLAILLLASAGCEKRSESARDGESKPAPVGYEGPFPDEAASPPAAPDLTRLNGVQHAIDGLLDANFGFLHPRRMRHGDTGEVRAILTFRGTTGELVARLQGEGVNVEGARVKVSEKASASLSSASFEVTPPTPVTQWVSATEPTEWVWDIKAKEVGRGTLYLALDAIISVDGKEATRRRTFSRTIEVDVAWPRTFAEWRDFVVEWGKGVEWVIGGIMVAAPALIVFWRKRRRPANDALNRPL